MEDPVKQTSKKKPAFAFWERQRKDSTCSLTDLAPPSTLSTSTSPPTMRRFDATQRSMTSSPSPQRLLPFQSQSQSHPQPQPQPQPQPSPPPPLQLPHAGASSSNGLSGVQRLIQQYSQSNLADAASSNASSSLNRSLSSRRTEASQSQIRRVASSSRSAAFTPADGPSHADGRADSHAARDTSAQSRVQAPLQSQSNSPSPSGHPSLSSALTRQPSTGVSSPSHAPQSTNSSATLTSRLLLDVDVVAPPASPPSSAVASTSQLQDARPTDSPKHIDVEKARRRRRLLQEQVRKRNSKRRSVGAIDITESLTLSGNDDHEAKDDVRDDADHHAELAPPSEAAHSSVCASASTSASASSAIPNSLHARHTHATSDSASSRRADLNSESDPTTHTHADVDLQPYHDAQTHLITPSRPTTTSTTTTVAVDLDSSSNAQINPNPRPSSFEDTRPWLEFSPLIPDEELLDSPTKPPTPSSALLQRSASSDLTASASQNSLPTDPNPSASARPSPSFSNSASLLSTDSPKSPTGLGLSTPPGYPSATSYLAIHSPTASSRIHRTTKLPPPRPSPQAPLPPPPSLAASTVSFSQSALAAAPTRSMRTSCTRTGAPVASVQDELDADVFGDPTSRSRSYSLEQEVASAERQEHMVLPPATPLSSQHAHVNHPRTDAAQTLTASNLAIPMIRERSDSLHRRDRKALEPSEAAPSRLAKMPPPNSTSPVAVASSSSRTGTASTKTAAVGRPRGFTVGAVPGHSNPVRGSAPVPTPSKTRPRSLLSNEIFPLDLAEPRYKSKSAREDNDNARKTYSMDMDRRISSLSTNNAVATSRVLSGAAGTSRGGIASTSIEERDGPGSNTSGDRLAAESTDRRPSVGGRSRSGSSASLLQQVNSQPKSHASFVIAVVGHAHSGKSTVIKKGLRQFGLSKPHVLSEKVTSHSTVCVVDQEQRTIEVLEIDASVLLNGPSKRFAWPKFLPHIDAVILCYDASEIASFRGMSELLENFSVANLITVMLACKSEVHPKAVDPYYASDMACIYNVGLAECTVQSEEGKKRMRDCFSYLVKEVAKARSGRARRGPANTVPPASAAMSSQRSLSPGAPHPSSIMQSRTASTTSQASSQNSLPRALNESGLIGGDVAASPVAFGEQLPSPALNHDPLRARGYSDVSSSLSGALGTGGAGLTDETGSAPAVEHTTLAGNSVALNVNPSVASSSGREPATANPDTRSNPRKMSTATFASGVSDAPSFQSDEDGMLHDSLQRAHMGLQNARSSGGYVSIEQLWDKLFHAAISRSDERFVSMFMVFFRGFATPMDLLEQMIARFETLTAEDVADGLVHRFALIRLANMLGDWVLDYPGDLSDPNTHALLIRYHRQLLRHPDTVHTATQIHAAVDAAVNAPDLDALWSKAVNSYQARHKGIAAALAEAQQADTGVEADGASALPASHSSSSATALMPSSGSTSHDFDGGAPHGDDVLDEHERAGSESSLHARPYEFEAAGRSRSASDLTASSTDVTDTLYKDAKQSMVTSTLSGSGVSGVSSVSGHTQTSSTSAGAVTSASATSLMGSGETNTSGHGRILDQKSTLRSISNVLMEVDDEIIATELTRLEWAFFTAIQPRDLLRHILVPHDKRDGPVSRSISHFNYISNWVCSMILAQSKTKHRARMLEKFFNIASILRHDNNYGSLNSVLGGLSKTAVHRLRHTRELLKGKAVNKAYQSLVRLMSNERSSAAYRLALENSDGPTIPYVGVHLQDIISISDGNPSKRASDGMIHWRKFSLMDEAVMAVARCQQYDRYIKPNSAVERLIVDVPVMDDEALYERSLAVEPRSAGGGGGVGVGVAAGKIKDLKTFLSHQASSHA